MLFIAICIVLIGLSFYIGYKHGRTVEKINNNLNENLKEGHQENGDLFIKDDKCEHDWKLFSSGYKQCKKCKSIVKNN
jgi:hypothetical protein